MSLKENLNKYDYLKEICKFSDLTNVNIEQLIKGVSNDEKKLWAMFARKKRGLNNDNSALAQICVQVGSSINIYSELRGILRCMISEPKKEKVSTEFTVDAYMFTTFMDKDSIKYRSIYNEFEDFIIYEIIAEKYLANIDYGDYDKINYSEVKFALEHRAYLWNPAPSTHGNKEREILVTFKTRKENKEKEVENFSVD